MRVRKRRVRRSRFYGPYRRLAKRFAIYIILKSGTLAVGRPRDPKLAPVALFFSQVKKGRPGSYAGRVRRGLGAKVRREPPIIRVRLGIGALCPTGRDGSANGASGAEPQLPPQTYR